MVESTWPQSFFGSGSREPGAERERFIRFVKRAARVAMFGGLELRPDGVGLTGNAANMLTGPDGPRELSFDAFVALFEQAAHRRISAAVQEVRDDLERVVEVEAALLRKEPSPRYFRLWIHGEGGCVYAVIQDVTPQRKEREMAQSAQRLEAVGRLAGGIAHDFNNLLTTILGSAELLVDAPDLDEVAGLSSEIQQAAERGRDLTQRLLSVARRREGVTQKTDICGLVAESHGMWQRVLGESCELAIDLPKGSVCATLDPRLFDQVIMNLLVNAKDASPDGAKVVIRVTAPEPSADGEEPWCTIAVCDHGRGMNAEELDRAFEPFFTTKMVGQATGLGLATSYAIAHQLGGSLEIESRPSQGTTVRMHLPVVDRDPTADLPVIGVEPKLPDGQRTVLILEDDEMVALTMTRMLRRVGFEVEVAVDLEGALAVMRRRPIDLLISDVVMPGRSGPEVARTLREHWPELRVLFVSGYAGTELERSGWRPDTPLLSKPFSGEELALKVGEILAD